MLSEYKSAGFLRSEISKGLLLVSILTKGGKLSHSQKGELKDIILAGSTKVTHAIECFELDNDVNELLDTLKVILQSADKNPTQPTSSSESFPSFSQPSPYKEKASPKKEKGTF